EFDQASQQDCLFRNLGDGTFEQIMDAGVDEAVTQGRGVATGDFDRDGDLDYTVSGGYDDWATLYRFEAGDHHWLDIDLGGRGAEGSNRDGIGALVTVEAGGHRQIRLVTPAGAPGSSQDLMLHFGLGEATSVDRISVRWPSGRVTEVTQQTRGDRRIEIEEPPAGR
ncbi:MAG: CRTAC1 family protein, partial [Deltaproteobacteria bacterium]